MFVPLHTKSDYSLGCGTAAVKDLVVRAASFGFTALGLTDIENVYGQADFHHQCRIRGLQPVMGVELRPGFDGRGSIGNSSGRLVLLAENQLGYRNICRIISRRREAAGPRDGIGRIGSDPLPLVAENGGGLFIMSDDTAVLERLIAIGAVSRHKIKLLIVRPVRQAKEDRIRTDAQRLGIRLAADIDAVFLDETDHDLHLLQLAVKKRIPFLAAAQDSAAEDRLRRLRTPDEAAALFSDLPQAVEETQAVADACRFMLVPDALHLPPARVGNANEPAHINLQRFCERAAAARRATRAHWSVAYDRRLADELALIRHMGFSAWFSIVAEIIEFCRSRHIAVAARGSAVSSLILHLLGASQVNPLAQGLVLERFLNPEKSQRPDVDLDIPYHRRDEVIAWIYTRFGRENVAMISSHHCFRYRSALHAGLTALGIRASQIKALSRLLPPETSEGWEAEADNAMESPSDEVMAPPAWFGPDLPPAIAKVLPLVARLVGRPRHMAVHPGGILVSGKPLEDHLPLERARKGLVMTQYDMAAAANLGLLKIDLLGNRCLTELEETLRLSDRPAQLSSIPDNDPETLALIDRADTLGCFQLESPAMRSLLSRLPIRRSSDIVAALALIRPGPAAGAAKNSFVARARGTAPAEPFDPIVADRIQETHGILLYEEDIMVLLSRVGGISLGQADRLRSDIVRSGGDPALLARLEAEFKNQARVGRGDGSIAEDRIRRAFAAAVRFAAYAFNKAHAASYGRLGYLAAFMKAHFPAAFACALFNHHQGIYPLRTLAAELMRTGIVVRAPHVNSSVFQSTLEKPGPGEDEDGVRIGLNKIKHLSLRSAEKLIAQRDRQGPFASLADFYDRVRPTLGQLKALVLSGSCDGLAPLDAGQYPLAHETVLATLRLDHPHPTGMPLRTPEPGDAEQFRLYQGLVRARNELRYLEMHLTVHPLALLRSEAGRYGCVTIYQAATFQQDIPRRLFVLVAAMRGVATRHGRMQYLTLEDETGLLESSLQPPIYARVVRRITTPGPFLVEGRMRNRQGGVHFEVDELIPFHQRGRPYAGRKK